MKALIIRDDDLSFWTNPNEIDFLYKPLFDKRIKISFAAIPCAVKSFNLGNFKSFYQDDNSQTPIFENKDIVEYIRDKIKEGLVEIMLHGYTHLYNFKSFDNNIMTASYKNLSYYRKNNKRIEFLGEFNSNSSFDMLNKKVVEGKKILEDTFLVKVHDFVPPSNQISKDGIRAIYNNNLNLSGFVGRKYNREFSVKGLLSLLRIIGFKILNKDISYPYIIDYGHHKELSGYALTPVTDKLKYQKQIKYCVKNNLPFQIATHYWELNKNEYLKKDFYEIVNKLVDLDFKSKFLQEILNG